MRLFTRNRKSTHDLEDELATLMAENWTEGRLVRCEFIDGKFVWLDQNNISYNTGILGKKIECLMSLHSMYYTRKELEDKIKSYAALEKKRIN